MNNNTLSMPVFLFHQGTNYRAYDLLGCHIEQCENGHKYVFRTWAPNADKVFVIGDFCSWEKGLPMTKISKGIWEAEWITKQNLIGSFYKYRIFNSNHVVDKADPYGFAQQTLDKTASVIWKLQDNTIDDQKWIQKRHAYFMGKKNTNNHFYPSPMNIYELHLASWMTKEGKCNQDGKHYLNYRDIADSLADYVKEMGYTHVELLPITEHPFDGSWGYQVCGYYAPSARYGTPDDFAYFVNRLHLANIGIILDWVPAHFPKDGHGLFEFDGHPLYEYQGADRMENKGWGTRCFDVGREEVQCFLISNALFWFRQYHIDGLRIDAVASMLYLDYDRKPGEWIPNAEGNNHNLEAISFFKKLNTAVFSEFPDALMIAEESTSWPMITKPVSKGGLGFNFKWNMGFANDMYSYVAQDPIYRQYEHTKLTFPLMYAFSENYVLPVSHDEVVHGKCSLYNKMFGNYDEKFSMMRAYLCFLMTQPGKKLLFMGTEFAQIREWDYENQLQWFMLHYPRHTEMQRYVKELNHFYLHNPALWEIDDSWDGFSWVDADRNTDNVVIYNRKDYNGKSLTIIINFSPMNRENYSFPIKYTGKYKIVFNSDRYSFGGNNYCDKNIIEANRKEDGKVYLQFNLPAYSAIVIRRTSYNAVESETKEEYTEAIYPKNLICNV